MNTGTLLLHEQSIALSVYDGDERVAQIDLRPHLRVDLPALRHPPMAAGDERTLDVGGRQTLAPLGWLDLG